MQRKSPYSRWRSLGLTLPFAISLFPVVASAACNPGDAGGAAYLELPVAPGGATANIYGQREANEPGLAGIAVKITDSTGKEQSVTTDASGNWSVAAPAFPLRVEFSPTAGLQSGASGSQSPSSVRFLDASSCSTDMGFQRPEDYSQPDPRVVIPVYRSGTGDGSTDPAIHSFPRSNTGLNSTYTDSNGTQGTGPVPDVDALVGTVGSTWGVGWQADKKRVFAASFLKRHVGIQNGLGYVYVLDEKTVPGTLAGKFNLQGVTPANGGAAIDLGSVCRDAACATAAGMTGQASDYELPAAKGSPSVDLDAFYKVGKVGFGDIDMQPSSNLLWLVNANQQALISVDVGNSDVVALPGAVNQYKIADLPGAPACTGGNLRPWALGFTSGKGYLGVTCDAYTSQSSADLKSLVLAFDPAAISAGFTTQLTFPLGYSRDSGHVFLPWLDEAATNSKLSSGAVNGQVDVPQPLLSDLEFDDNGNMYLNIMDIFPHQTGNYNYKPFSGETGGKGWINGIANGDFLKACKTASGFALEGDKDCPVNFANGVGPNAAGEFFEDSAGDGRAESATGAMAVLHGSGQIDAVLMDPHPTGQTGQQWWTSQGINAYNLSDGKVANWYSIHHADQPGMFGKGSGLGDMELMTDPAPTEVGNRVWLDTNSNGIQDAGEAGIDGVDVKLVCGTDTATAKTANGGQYLFSNATGGNATFMKAGASCTVQVDSTQAPVKAYTLAAQNADAATDNNPTTDLHDSDATDNAGTAEIAFKVGNAGENNHTLDVGYKSAPAPTYSIGNRVWVDTNNNGLAEVGEAAASTGVKLELKDSGGAVLNTTTTDANGRYLFSGLVAGSYQVCVAADNFAAAGLLANYTASTGGNQPDANTDIDGDDNGDDDTSKGLCSNVVVLDTKEPLLETTATGNDGNDAQGTPDANSNLTVDFGVVPPAPKADISLTKTADKTSVKPGETVVYTLTASNAGEAAATGVAVTDKLPTRVAWVSDDSAGAYDPATGIWTIGALAKDGAKTLKITATIN